MLVMFLIYTFKKHFKGFSFFVLGNVFKSLTFRIKYILPFIFISSTNLNTDTSDIEKMSFSIIKKGVSIGYVNIKKTTLNKFTTYTTNSEVHAKIIFNFNAVGEEKSVYKQDTLIYSLIYRKLNNKVKLNHSLLFEGGNYVLEHKGKKDKINFNVIHNNLVRLFFHEPVGIQEIYSDMDRTMVKIMSISNGKYKVTLPNKSSCIYHYKNGKCIMMEAVGSFFKVKLIQVNNI